MHAVGMLFVIAAVGLAGYTAWESWWARASRVWPTVPGTVTESKVQHDWNRRLDNPMDNPTPPNDRAKIEYHYEVNGQVYWGGRVAYNGPSGVLAAQRTVDRYPRGTAVTVAYDPGDPRRGVLEPGLRTGDIALAFGVAALVLVLGLVLLMV